MKLIIPIICLIFPSCAARVAVKESELSQPRRVLVFVEGSEPKAYVANPISSSLLMFGAIGGAVSGVIETVSNQPRLAILQRAFPDNNYTYGIESGFLSSWKPPILWQITPASTIFNKEQQKGLAEYFLVASNPIPVPQTKDRSVEEREKAVFRDKVKRLRDDLQIENYDLIIRLRMEFFGLKGTIGDEDFTAEMSGRMIDTKFPKPATLWNYSISSKKRPGAKRIDFSREKERPIEEIRAELLSRAKFTYETLARDFD